MNPNEPQSGKPEFNEPVEYDIGENQPIIYLNKAQNAFLARKEEEYRRRLTGEPKVRLDTRVKLLLISALRSKGYATPGDITDNLTREEIESVPVGGIARLMHNAFLVIGSYNTGKEEHIRHVHKNEPEIPAGGDDHQQRVAENRRRFGEAMFALTNRELSPLEKTIGIHLAQQAQTPEEIDAQHTVMYPQSRQQLLDYLKKYVATHREEIVQFKHIEDAMADLARNLHIVVDGEKIDDTIVTDTLISLVFQARLSMKLHENK